MSARQTQRKPLKRLKTGSGFPAWRVAPPLRPIRGSDAPGPRSEEVAKVTGLGAYPTEKRSVAAKRRPYSIRAKQLPPASSCCSERRLRRPRRVIEHIASGGDGEMDDSATSAAVRVAAPADRLAGLPKPTAPIAVRDRLIDSCAAISSAPIRTSTPTSSARSFPASAPRTGTRPAISDCAERPAPSAVPRRPTDLKPRRKKRPKICSPPSGAAKP